MKTFVKVFCLIMIGALFANMAFASMRRPLSVETVEVSPETVVLTFTEQGYYDYENTYTVFPVIYGEILEVRATEGETVNQGDVLAVVNASEYQYQIGELRSAIDGYNAQIQNLYLQEQQENASLETNLESLRGQLASLEAEVQQAYDNNYSLDYQIEIQERIIENSKRIVQDARDELNDAEDYGEDEEVTAARQTYNNARNNAAQQELTLEQLKSGNIPPDIYSQQRATIMAQINSVKSQMERSYSGAMFNYYQSQIAATEYNIRQLQEKAGKASIVSPVGGIIKSLPVNTRNIVSQQSEIAVIVNHPRIEVFVPLREIDGVHVGDKVELVLDKRLGAETIGGTVTDIANEAQVKLSALGVEERKVRVLIVPEDTSLQIGYNMDVRFEVYTQEDSFVVPKTAVFSQDGADYVWVVVNGIVRKRQITKGVETRSGYVADEGLSTGDIVIRSADNADLEDGKQVDG